MRARWWAGLGAPLAAESLGSRCGTTRTALSSASASQVNCAALDSAVASLNRRWVLYSPERKKIVGPLDSARAAVDYALYAAMDSGEIHHDQSRCPRP